MQHLGSYSVQNKLCDANGRIADPDPVGFAWLRLNPNSTLCSGPAKFLMN